MQGAHKKLVILDLNGVLAERKFADQLKTDDYPGATVVNRDFMWKRPHLDEFLDYLFANFSVGIWSSMTMRNVEPYLKFVLGDDRTPLFVWDQEHCWSVKHPEVDYKMLHLKSLQPVFAEFEFTEEDTLIIDDGLLKIQSNPADCRYVVKTWEHTDTEDAEFAETGELRQRLADFLENGNKASERVCQCCVAKKRKLDTVSPVVDYKNAIYY